MKISSSCELSSYLPLNQLVWHEECETLRLKRL
ncbi:transcriptional regulator, partial [Xanthomonas citri pv. citri]|nr:transcriptional regulator [Xanthomonas citri pv. citri]